LHFDWEQNAFPFPVKIRTGCPVGLLVKPFFARCLPSLFHQSRFDWESRWLIRSGIQTPPCHPQAALSVQKVGREALAVLISPIAL
jgi:hypothetical protein